MEASRLQGVDDRLWGRSSVGEYDRSLVRVLEMGDVGTRVCDLEMGVDDAGGRDEAWGWGEGESVRGSGIWRAEG